MCGTYGLAWRNGNITGNRAKSAAQAMQRVLGHRGPDGTGLLERDGLMLGHLRLAIIDLAGGAQPMVSPDGRVALSYNGECYNFLGLMDDLSRCGWNFASRCDSEVLLAGYTLQGPEFDEALNGMYAYAMLDERAGRRIQLSTDPVGIKPMFLYEDDEVFLFASELRGIVVGLRALGKRVDVDSEAVEAYLRLGWVPAPLSLVTGARKLAPGERWILDLDRWSATCASKRLRRQGEVFRGDENDLQEALRRCLSDVVKRQTISDVPLGFFLSGGVDSSLLLAIAAELGIAAQSFTISFVGDGHGVASANEGEVARAVAGHLGSPINIIEVEADTLRRSLWECLDAMDQPLADPACLPLLLLSRLAAQKVKVCLSGDGGDELFAGYTRHRIARLKSGWRSLPSPLRALTRAAASHLPTAPSTGYRENLRRVRVAHELIDSPNYVDGPFAQQITHQEVRLEPWNQSVMLSSAGLMEADIEGQLAGQMLPKTDNMTMAASLECRVPLLDLDLIELASGVPLEMKSRERTGKYPLRKLLGRYLPAEITQRPKHGFRVPLTDWLRGPMAGEIRDRLLCEQSEVAEFLTPLQTETVVNEHLSGRGEHSIRLWALLAFSHWREQALGGSRA